MTHECLSLNDACVLTALEPGESLDGAALAKAAAISRQQAHEILGRLERLHLVRSKPKARQPGERGRPRRQFRITALGERNLRAWRAAEKEMAAAHSENFTQGSGLVPPWYRRWF